MAGWEGLVLALPAGVAGLWGERTQRVEELGREDGKPMCLSVSERRKAKQEGSGRTDAEWGGRRVWERWASTYGALHGVCGAHH